MTDLLIMIVLVVGLDLGALGVMAGAVMIVTMPALWGEGAVGILTSVVVFIGAACALLEQLRP